MLQMEREIHQLKRAISIRENLGITDTMHHGKAVPGLSTSDWKAKLAHIESCYAKRIPYQAEDSRPEGVVREEDADAFGATEGPYYESNFGF